MGDISREHRSDASSSEAVDAQTKNTRKTKGRGVEPMEWSESDAGQAVEADRTVSRQDPDPDLESTPEEQVEAPGKAEDQITEESTAAETPAVTEAEADDRPVLENPEELSRVLFAVLLSSRSAVSMLRLTEVANAPGPAATKAALQQLQQDLEAGGWPLCLQITGEQVRLLTAPAVYPYLNALKVQKKADKLSQAALETLAVIAYRQPVIRAEIEAIRGVKAGPILRTLLEHQLVQVVGRADVPGRPLQYGTTQTFLERFGLESLEALPSVQEFRSLG